MKRWLMLGSALALFAGPAMATVPGVTTGTLINVNDAIQAPLAGQASSAGLSVTSDTNVTLVVEGTVDGSTWSTLTGTVVGGTSTATSFSSNGQWTFNTGGLASVRARATVSGATPTATVLLLGAPSSIPGAGGGGGNVNINQINGAAPSLINPLWIANAEAVDTSGAFTNATQTTSVTNSNADGYAAGLISINGTYGAASGVFEESDDAGTTWYSVICARSDGTASETGYTALTNTNRQWSCPVGGNDSVRVRSTAVASGTVNARVGISAPPPSSNTVAGTVGLSSSATSTAPVSIQQTTTASPVQLASNALTNGVIFQIDAADTGTVCVGTAGVTTSTGYCMSNALGRTAGSLGVNNTNLLYVVGTNTSDKISFLGN